MLYDVIYWCPTLVIIGSGNGLPPIRHKATTWTNADLLSTGRHKQASVKFESKYNIFIKENISESKSAK